MASVERMNCDGSNGFNVEQPFIGLVSEQKKLINSCILLQLQIMVMPEGEEDRIT